MLGFFILWARKRYPSFTTKLLKNYRESAHSISLIFTRAVYDGFTVADGPTDLSFAASAQISASQPCADA
jgi:hypothetical protein